MLIRVELDALRAKSDFIKKSVRAQRLFPVYRNMVVDLYGVVQRTAVYKYLSEDGRTGSRFSDEHPGERVQQDSATDPDNAK